MVNKESLRKFAACLALLDELPRTESEQVVKLLEQVYRRDVPPLPPAPDGKERWIAEYEKRIRGKSGRRRTIKVRGHWSKVRGM